MQLRLFDWNCWSKVSNRLMRNWGENGRRLWPSQKLFAQKLNKFNDKATFVTWSVVGLSVVALKLVNTWSFKPEKPQRYFEQPVLLFSLWKTLAVIAVIGMWLWRDCDESKGANLVIVAKQFASKGWMGVLGAQIVFISIGIAVLTISCIYIRLKRTSRLWPIPW
jgi:hypothetical protein